VDELRYCQPGAVNCVVCAMAHRLRLTVYAPDQGWFAVIRPSSLNDTLLYAEATSGQLRYAVMSPSI